MTNSEKDDRDEADQNMAAVGAAPDDVIDDGEINDNDIVFDCPNCGHGLVINYRGAGLIINCAECNQPVQVPIPDGMELADLDQEPEELQNQIRNLRRALYKAEERGRELEDVVNSLKERRTILEKERVSQLHRLAEIRGAFEHVQRLHGEIGAVCSRIFEMIQVETR
ncbi:MAG: hypothetical protein GX590_12420 [Lentisphaerae bacterium]|nr:hypothetical protein [Lentisphaerota bacterium]